MDRMACVELPAFPLQLLLKQHPDWADRPVAVVDRDKPQGVILWVNEQARAARIRTGTRYSAGLSLARTLHAGEVSATAIEAGLAALVDRLRRFSPEVEPCPEEPGVFWLNASGLSHLYASPRQWANEINTALQASGFRASIAVGFSRFGTYAIAKTVAAGAAVAVVRDQTRERVLAGQVPLEQLWIDPSLRDSLQKIGVRNRESLLAAPGRRHPSPFRSGGATAAPIGGRRSLGAAPAAAYQGSTGPTARPRRSRDRCAALALLDQAPPESAAGDDRRAPRDARRADASSTPRPRRPPAGADPSGRPRRSTSRS